MEPKRLILLFCLCGAAFAILRTGPALATMISVLECMGSGWVEPLGNELSPFFVYSTLNHTLISCRDYPFDFCRWTEQNNSVYAALFVYKRHKLLTVQPPVRQLNIRTLQLTRETWRTPGTVVRVLDFLFSHGVGNFAKIAYQRMINYC